MPNLLTWTMLLPSIGALILFFFGTTETERDRQNIKRVSFIFTVLTLLASLIVMSKFDTSNPDFQLLEAYSWIRFMNYRVGVDGISILFVLLTTLLMPIVIGASWNVTTRVKEYFIAFLLLETLMIGVFIALDLVLFYLFFEAGLIPMFLIIGIWGGKNRVYAAFKFFLYTLLGSLLMLVAMVYMILAADTSSIPELMHAEFAYAPMKFMGITIVGGVQTLLFFAFFASFAVKLPMWPVHTWLPDAHVQAPTAGSVVLAAVLLKMGGYGFIRFSLTMFPDASLLWQDFILGLSVIAIIYTSLVALVQTDMKKLIAYSSVAHMGYVTLGIFAFNQQGLDGAIFQMLSHGFISAALFLVVGVIYDRMHTREIAAFGGLVARMPVYALVFMFFTMGNVGLPGTSGFIGEFLTLVGTFQTSTWAASLAATGVILSAAYALWLYRRVVFGQLVRENLKSVSDMSRREALLFVPLIVATLLLGIFPSLVLDVVSPATEILLETLPNANVSTEPLVQTIAPAAEIIAPAH